MIETERLILRRWIDADHPPFAAMGRDEAVMEFLGPLLAPVEVEAAIVRLNGILDTYGSTFWVLERREDSAFMGFTGIKPGPAGTPIADKPEIGWRLATAFHGQGYAFEAAQASLNWHWANFPDSDIYAITVPANVKSWGLMERLGMTRRVGMDFGHPNVPADSPLYRHITYSIARSDCGVR